MSGRKGRGNKAGNSPKRRKNGSVVHMEAVTPPAKGTDEAGEGSTASWDHKLNEQTDNIFNLTKQLADLAAVVKTQIKPNVDHKIIIGSMMDKSLATPNGVAEEGIGGGGGGSGATLSEDVTRDAELAEIQTEISNGEMNVHLIKMYEIMGKMSGQFKGMMTVQNRMQYDMDKLCQENATAAGANNTGEETKLEVNNLKTDIKELTKSLQNLANNVTEKFQTIDTQNQNVVWVIQK